MIPDSLSSGCITGRPSSSRNLRDINACRHLLRLYWFHGGGHGSGNQCQNGRQTDPYPPLMPRLAATTQRAMAHPPARWKQQSRAVKFAYTASSIVNLLAGRLDRSTERRLPHRDSRSRISRGFVTLPHCSRSLTPLRGPFDHRNASAHRATSRATSSSNEYR